MAFRLGLSARASLLGRRYHPSFSHLLHRTDDRRENSCGRTPCHENLHPFLQQRSFLNSSAGFTAAVGGRVCRDSFLLPSIGSSFCRYMSTAVGDPADNTELMVGVSDVFTDTTLQSVASQAPAANEVAIAAADSFPPIMVLQHLIDFVHQFSGFNWWASIALTTIMIRTLLAPFAINQIKASSKLAIIRPQLEEIKSEMQNNDMSDPETVAKGRRKMEQLFRETGVTPFTPMKGMFIQAPVFISFFLAITNMVDKVPSFKSGGAYWFTDLTTPDSFCILPILTGLSFLIVVEHNLTEGMEGNPNSTIMKNLGRGMAVLNVPLTMSFAPAILCYWIASNLYSLGFSFVLKQPGVRNYVGIPKVPVQTAIGKPSSNDVFSALEPESEELSSVPSDPSKLGHRRVSSFAELSKRLRSLEREVKERKNKIR